MEIPNKLIVCNGKLKTKDGTSVDKYLAGWQSNHGFSDIDVIILPRNKFIESEEDKNRMIVTHVWEWRPTLRERFHNFIHFLTK